MARALRCLLKVNGFKTKVNSQPHTKAITTDRAVFVDMQPKQETVDESMMRVRQRMARGKHSVGAKYKK